MKNTFFLRKTNEEYLKGKFGNMSLAKKKGLNM